MVNDTLEPRSTNTTALSSLDKVLCGLRFYATGSMKFTIGDTHCISQSSISRYKTIETVI